YAKKGLKKFNEYLFVVLAIGIGLAISIGLFSLYYSYATQNKEEITITSNSVILPSIFIYLGVELVSVVAGKLLSLKMPI
ncbi:MAG: hypothetical protein J5666_02475, partial [Bacilli bacterium]|nr:hypothetical protein [Bacilli bacterium]